MSLFKKKNKPVKPVDASKAEYKIVVSYLAGRGYPWTAKVIRLSDEKKMQEFDRSNEVDAQTAARRWVRARRRMEELAKQSPKEYFL